MTRDLQDVGIAFVGGGMVSELHARALQSISGCRFVGLYDVDPAVSARRSAAWGCRTFPSLPALLRDPGVDAVFVLTPLETHEAVASQALEVGKHVLVEKPVGSQASIGRLLALSRDRGVVCMPGHNYAYQPEFLQMRRLVRDGSLGDVRAAWVTYAIRHPEEIAARYVGVLAEVMIHHTYLTLALFGEPSKLYAGRMEPAWVSHREEDQAWMTWHYPGGLSVHHFCSFAVDDDTSDPWTFVVKVLGTRGGVTYSWRSALVRRALGTLSIGIPAYEDSYVHEVHAFLAAVRGEAEAIVSPLADAARSAHILDVAMAADAQAAGLPIE